MPGELERALGSARQKYADLYVLRAGIQAIPHLGGPIDTLIAGGYAGVQARRIESFVDDLRERMSHVESVAANLEDEAFADLIVATFERVARTRSELKRARFATIVAAQAERARPWDEPETAVRLLADLEDAHIDVLQLALASLGPGVHHGPRVVDLGTSSDKDSLGHTHLVEALPQYPLATLRMACAELTARGLLVDYGAERWGGGIMRSFVATELGSWFSSWLSQPHA